MLKEKWLWMITMMLIIVFFNAHGCWEEERVALLHIKAYFSHPHFFRRDCFATWEEDKGSDCCDGWDGVTCGSDGRVVTLSLSYCTDSVQHLNASVFLPFQQLRELDLSFNDIFSWTEDQGSNMKLSLSLTKLETLDLDNNNFNSSILPHLSGFQSLKRLRLRGNKIYGDDGFVKLNDFAAFKNLQELDLSDSNITGIISYYNGSHMKLSLNLTKLETLDLSDNNFNSSILPHLSGFQSLKRLRLGGNKIYGDDGFVKLNDFAAFKNLQELDLTGSNIKGIISYYNENTDVGKVSSPLRSLERLYLIDNLLNRSMDILSQLKGLHSLKYLSLADNQISGLNQPCDIETLRNLEELDLSYNYYFQGFINCNGSEKGSSSLTNLKILDLSGTSLNNSTLPHLSGFPSLEHLLLSYNKFLKQPYGLCQLEKLQTLDLSYNDYLDEMLPPCLGNLTALRALDLSYNQLAGNIPSWMSNLSTLHALDLSYNQLAGNIPSWMSNLSTLQQLNLSHNLFTENIDASSVLANLTNLETLELSGNHFQIPSSFVSFANHTKLKRFVADFNEVIIDSQNQPSAPGFQLQVLSLSNCRLTAYPSFLHHQYNLLIVDLSNNFLKGGFPTWLVENTSSLKGLFLQNNSITGSFQLPSSSHPTNVVALDISQNQIQGQIPEHMGDVFPRLQLLNMFSNELQGKIPWSFGRMKSLWDLDLSNNNLIGTLPRSLLEGCSSLRSLIVSNNSLDGQIPSFSLHHLSILNLGNNLLEGPIPIGICSLHRLKYLDISYNKLDGSIPSCFSNMSSLNSIHLSDNKLTGQMILPYECELVTLDLNNNKLYGSIPSQIANCNFLNALLLQGNMLDGEIPIQLCRFGNLYILDLSHNNLSGSIPSCLSSVEFHIRLRMSYSTNTLQDSVVKAYVNAEINRLDLIKDLVDFTTKSLKYSYDVDKDTGVLCGIDLSCNMLMGKIPEFGNLTNIQSLNISHNHIWGDIPKSFSNLSQIESLDLSYNSLSGSIPTELTALHFLEVFRVMHNNLSGKIPFESQFSTFDASIYEGNPFLCGPPLSKKCALPPANANGFQDHVVEDDSGWIDMENFYVSFVVTSIIMFLVVLLILWINPNWRRAWFYLATNCATSSYYFVEDIIRKIKRVRNV